MGEPQEKRFQLRIDEGLYEGLEEWAKEELRSVNSQIVTILRAAVAEHRRQRTTRRPIDSGGTIESESKIPSLAAA